LNQKFDLGDGVRRWVSSEDDIAAEQNARSVRQGRIRVAWTIESSGAGYSDSLCLPELRESTQRAESQKRVLFYAQKKKRGRGGR
jgi:hypothetical protein